MGKRVGSPESLVGKRFNRLLVQENLGSRRGSGKNYHVYYKCLCDCGESIEVRGSSLTSANTQSCGCLSKEVRGKATLTHGLAGKNYKDRPTHYKLWAGASSRASRDNIPFNIEPEDIFIPEYCPLLGIKLAVVSGLTGKKVQDNSPSLDKIDPSKGYTKENVWVISNLANRMKNSATKEQLLLFAKNIQIKFACD